jgi:hypothetical protein
MLPHPAMDAMAAGMAPRPPGAPGAPTQTTIGRIDESKAFLTPLTDKMAEITTKDIPELNKLLAEKKIDYIKIL